VTLASKDSYAKNIECNAWWTYQNSVAPD